MAVVYLGLGTNLGDKEANLNNAIYEIEELVGTVLSISSFYETEPWGFTSSNMFLNAAIGVETELTPGELLRIVQDIENDMGRESKTENGIYEDRVIDIDILLYGDKVVQTQRLQIPHPLIAEREFVLTPLKEIAPDVVHTLLGMKIKDL